MIISTLKIVIIALYSCFMAGISILCVPFVSDEKLLFKIFKLFARGVLRLSGVCVIVHGVENIAEGQNYLYVANHASYFDIPAVVAGIPDNVRFVYKKELNKVPIFGWGMKLTKYNIAINRTSGHDAMQSLDVIAERMQKGASVMLFAEGTRTPDGSMHAFKRGPFNLAAKAGVSVVPVAIKGSYDVMSRHSWRIQPGTITLVLGKPVAPSSINGKQTEFELRDRVRSIIEENLLAKG